MESKGNSVPASFIEILLLSVGVVSMLSGAIWTFTGLGDEGKDIWTWFSRFALGVICFGFAGVIREIRKLRKDD